MQRRSRSTHREERSLTAVIPLRDWTDPKVALARWN